MTDRPSPITPRLDEPVPGGRPQPRITQGLRLGEVRHPSPRVRFAVARLGRLQRAHFEPATPEAAPESAPPPQSAEPISELGAREAGCAVAHLLSTASAQGLKVKRIDPAQLSTTLGISLSDVREGLELIRDSSDSSVRGLLPWSGTQD